MRIRLLSLLCLTLSLPCAAWNVRTDAQGDLVHWDRPVKLVLDSDFAVLIGDPEAEAAVRAAVENYEEATPYFDVSVTVGHAKPLGYVEGSFDNENSILALADWPYSENALAVTLVTLDSRTNKVVDADIAFNVSSHKFRVLPEGANDEHEFDDVQNTVTHELGHVLGLMHSGTSSDLVMYPTAPPGETLKRTLKTDDREGLLSLYGEAPDPSWASCSATSGSASWLVLLLVLGLFRKRRRLALFALMPAAAMAAVPVPAPISRAEDVALVEVGSQHSLQHPKNPGLIVTELTIAPIECLKGSCTGLTRVVVPGGKLGDLEQIAVHEPVPAEGQRLLVTRSAGVIRVLRLDPVAQEQIVRALRPTSINDAQIPHSSATVP